MILVQATTTGPSVEADLNAIRASNQLLVDRQYPYGSFLNPLPIIVATQDSGTGTPVLSLLTYTVPVDRILVQGNMNIALDIDASSGDTLQAQIVYGVALPPTVVKWSHRIMLPANNNRANLDINVPFPFMDIADGIKVDISSTGVINFSYSMTFTGIEIDAF